MLMSTLHVPIVLNGGSNPPTTLKDRELFLYQNNGNSFLYAGIGSDDENAIANPVAVMGLGTSNNSELSADELGGFINLKYLKYGEFGNEKKPTLVFQSELEVRGLDKNSHATLRWLDIKESTLQGCTLNGCYIDYGTDFPDDAQPGQLFFRIGSN